VFTEEAVNIKSPTKDMLQQSIPLSTWGTIDADSEPRFHIAESKTKVKTRPDNEANGVDAGLRVEVNENPLVAIENQPCVQITVNMKHLPLLTQMLMPYRLARGSVKWKEFAAAMTDAGFSLVHNGGSAVTLTDEENNQGSIVVHKPHPKAEYVAVELRTIGKRCRDRFGWDENTFVARLRGEI
jgi:hypothetical protein